jgi:transposase-like protein
MTWERRLDSDVTDEDLWRLAEKGGMSVREIARRHGISKSVAAARIARHRKRLAEEKARRDEEARQLRNARERAERRGFRRDPNGIHSIAELERLADSERYQRSAHPAPLQEVVLRSGLTGYMAWLDERDFHAGRISAEELARRRRPRPFRVISL